MVKLDRQTEVHRKVTGKNVKSNWVSEVVQHIGEVLKSGAHVTIPAANWIKLRGGGKDADGGGFQKGRWTKSTERNWPTQFGASAHTPTSVYIQTLNKLS